MTDSNQTNSNVVTDIDPLAAKIYRDSMCLFASEMEDTNIFAKSIASRTTLIIRIVTWMTILSAIYLVYTVFILGGDMQRLAASMVEMYQHFGTMAKDVGSMTRSVTDMGQTMQGLPAIAEDMQAMSGILNNMTNNVASMNSSVSHMDGNMGSITNDMHTMNDQMSRMTNSVNYMRHNIGEMARPMP